MTANTIGGSISKYIGGKENITHLLASEIVPTHIYKGCRLEK
jgi:hypothetical protein